MRFMGRASNFLHALFFINCSRDAPDYDSGIRAALAHNGHPCGCRYLQGLRDIRNYDEQNVPCDRMESKHPSGITAFAGKQHYEMNPEEQYHRDIHRENCEEHIVLIGANRCDCGF